MQVLLRDLYFLPCDCFLLLPVLHSAEDRVTYSRICNWLASKAFMQEYLLQHKASIVYNSMHLISAA